MEYLPLFLLFMAALIAAYFYLERAKRRGAPADQSGQSESNPGGTSTD